MTYFCEREGRDVVVESQAGAVYLAHPAPRYTRRVGCVCMMTEFPDGRISIARCNLHRALHAETYKLN